MFGVGDVSGDMDWRDTAGATQEGRRQATAGGRRQAGQGRPAERESQDEGSSCAGASVGWRARYGSASIAEQGLVVMSSSCWSCWAWRGRGRQTAQSRNNTKAGRSVWPRRSEQGGRGTGRIHGGGTGRGARNDGEWQPGLRGIDCEGAERKGRGKMGRRTWLKRVVARHVGDAGERGGRGLKDRCDAGGEEVKAGRDEVRPRPVEEMFCKGKARQLRYDGIAKSRRGDAKKRERIKFGRMGGLGDRGAGLDCWAGQSTGLLLARGGHLWRALDCC